MHAHFLSAMCLLFGAFTLHAGEPPTPEQARRELIEAYKEYAKFLEKRVKAQAAASPGIVSETQIDLERWDLATVLHDLAIFEDNREEAVRQSRLRVETMQRMLDRVMKAYDAGADSRGNLDECLWWTACARYDLALEEGKTEFAAGQLHLITDLTGKRWNDMKRLHEQGAATRRELEHWERRRAMAAYFSLQSEQNRKEAIAQLRKAIGLQERGVERVKQARQLTAASEWDELVALHSLAETRLRLAVREKDATAATTQIELQVALCEKLVTMARSRVDVEWQLPECRYHLAMARDRLAQSKLGLSHIILCSPGSELKR